MVCWQTYLLDGKKALWYSTLFRFCPCVLQQVMKSLQPEQSWKVGNFMWLIVTGLATYTITHNRPVSMLSWIKHPNGIQFFQLTSLCDKSTKYIWWIACTKTSRIHPSPPSTHSLYTQIIYLRILQFSFDSPTIRRMCNVSSLTDNQFELRLHKY